MSEPQFLVTTTGRAIAYHYHPGDGPGLVFLGGFKSDMEGTKAIYLEDWARSQGRAFLRMDYSGHGQSSGNFLDGCIGDWAQDVIETIQTVTSGPQVVVGSSMGGWIALLVARALPDRLAGLVGIAAAPDFTEDSMWDGFDDAQRAALMGDGRVELPSDYSDEPYVITRRLIEDGRDQLVLRDPLTLHCPVRLLHGTEDTDVDQSVPLRLINHATCDDLRLTLVKGSDHRFSEPQDLELIKQAVEEVTARSSA